MIKLPIRLETEANWQQCLADAIARREELQNLALKEMRSGEKYLRPIVLIQAQARSKVKDTLHTHRVYDELLKNHAIPEQEIIIATGEEKGLEQIEADYEGGILSEDCPVKFVITQQALAEGWDCPFAYILVSMAEVKSSTAVEQLLGRVLRQPNAKCREHEALNRSYAFVVSHDFNATAEGLRDRLVQGAGFERKEAAEFVSASTPEQEVFDYRNEFHNVVIRPVIVELSHAPEMKKIPAPVRAKLDWDKKSSTLTIKAPLTVEETEKVKLSINEPEAIEVVEKAALESRTTAVEFFQTPAEKGLTFRIPQLTLIIQGELELFDDVELLGYPWDLSFYDANPSADELERLDAINRVASGGELDIDEGSGRMKSRFMPELQRDLGLIYNPEHWDEVKLAAWFCRNLPEESLTHTSKLAFVTRWLSQLLNSDHIDLAKVNQRKFEIRNLLDSRIRELHKQAAKQAYQETLFGEDAAEQITVSDEYAFVFNPYAYAPNKDYKNEYGQYDFCRHYYGRIGDFDSKEEFECAVWLDQQAQKGKIEFWVRNLVRKEGSSFFLQKAGSKFYPDFICKLPDETILIVEYKGADKWDTPKVKEDRMLGQLWANMSNGKCKFIMLKDRDWNSIDGCL